MARWVRSVNSALEMAAQRYDLPLDWLREIARVESSGRPGARGLNGYYHGLFQLTERDFLRLHGGPGGDIYNPRDNAMAGARRLAEARQWHKDTFGTEPTLGQLYMIHNQGPGGYAAHRRNPDAPAWVNMASTLEGRTRGEAWAQRAVRLNVPGNMRRRSNELTSADLIASFDQRFAPRQPRQDFSSVIAGLNEAGNMSRPPRPQPNMSFAPDATDAAVEAAVSGEQLASPNAAWSPTVARNEPTVNDVMGKSLTNNQKASMLSAISEFGRSIASSANRPAPQVQLVGGEQPQDQDPRAFVLQPPRRRVYA